MDSYSAFDPSVFLDAQTTEVNERRAPLPVDNPAASDGLYTATIGEPKTKTGTREDGSPWVQVRIPLVIDVPQQFQEGLKLPEQLTFTDSGFLDLTPDNKGLDNAPGKNRFQKKYRDTLGLNVAGQPFAWRMVQGRPVKVKLSWKMIPDNMGGQVPMEEIAAVLKAQ